MAKSKFPMFVHVTQEKDRDGTPYLQIREDGVREPDIDTTRPFAVYKLDTEGVVHVSRTYVPNQPKPRRRA